MNKIEVAIVTVISALGALIVVASLIVMGHQGRKPYADATVLTMVAGVDDKDFTQWLERHNFILVECDSPRPDHVRLHLKKSGAK